MDSRTARATCAVAEELTADPRLLDAANTYLLERGLVPHPRSIPLVSVDPAHGQGVAAAYDSARHEPDRPEVAAAYAAFGAELVAQFEHLRAAGYVFRPWLKQGQPYPDSGTMRRHLTATRSLFFFIGGDMPADHLLAAPSGVTIEGHPLALNEVLRACHDALGHAVYGLGFGLRGEFTAASVHAAMFSPAARAALVSETAAQAAWFYRGPAAHVPVPDRPFPAQKACVLTARWRLVAQTGRYLWVRVKRTRKTAPLPSFAPAPQIPSFAATFSAPR